MLGETLSNRNHQRESLFHLVMTGGNISRYILLSVVKPSVLRFLFFRVGIVLVAGIAGCVLPSVRAVRLNDPGALNAIEDARQHYDVYQKGSAEMISRARNVVLESDAIVAELRQDLAGTVLETVVRNVPRKSIAEIETDIGKTMKKAKTEVESLSEDISLVKTSAEEARQFLKEAILAESLAKEKYDAFQKSLEEQEKHSQAVKKKLEELIAALLTPSGTDTSAEETDLQQALGELRKATKALADSAEALASESGTLYLDIFTEAVIAADLGEKFGDVFIFKKRTEKEIQKRK